MKSALQPGGLHSMDYLSGGKTMRGVTFLGNRQAEIREFPDPHAGPGEAVVKSGRPVSAARTFTGIGTRSRWT